MRYADIDKKTGEILGWYDKATAPSGCVPVKDDVWKAALAGGHNKLNDDGTTERCDLRTKKEIDEETEAAERLNAMNYLAETDWYVMRKVETGKEIPNDISSAREKARESIK